MNKKITIVMATYNPESRFFEEQLQSIESQTYDNIELLIRDDCSTSEEFEKINKIATKVLKKIPFEISQNEVNLGSNKTFEKLVELASGDYIGLSDQDDVFDENKFEKLVELLESEGAVLAYSDARVIDSVGNVTNTSFKAHAKRVVHIHGDNMGPAFIRRNSVTGCTMLIRTNIAKLALPFPNYAAYVHDHWLTLIAATQGRISYCEMPLISYRIHGNNQIGSSLLKGVEDKKTYLENKLRVEEIKYSVLAEKSRFFNQEMQVEVQAHIDNMESRQNFFRKVSAKNFAKLVTTKKVDSQLFVYEVLLAVSPKFVQRKLISMYKR